MFLYFSILYFYLNNIYIYYIYNPSQVTHPGSASLFGLKSFQAFPSFFLIFLYGVLKI